MSRRKRRSLRSFFISTEQRIGFHSNVMELIADLYSGEIASRSSRTVNISGVTLHSLIEIVLISIEHILHTCTQLQVHRLIKFEIIGHLDSHIEEIACIHRHILVDITGHVLHQHRAGVRARQG